MLVNVKGKVLEKYQREFKNNDGVKQHRLFIRLYQKGQRTNLDVSVTPEIYSTLEEDQDIELEDVIISVYNNNLYARV